MKKLNKFFAILFAVLGVTTLKAQTDVTSTYLTNADFSSTTGWTAYVSNQYKDYGNGKIGGKLASYAASTVDDTHLSSEHFFGFQCRWSSNYASYNQTTSEELPAGVYTLSYDVENVNGSTTAAAYNNLFYVKVGDRTFTDTSTEWMKGKSSWTTHSITFVITEPTQATISLGYGTGSNNFGTANTPVLYVSHLNLTHRNIDDISAENPADLTSYIVNNSFETGNLNGWTVGGYSSDTGVKPNSNGTYTTSGVDGNYLFNTWWKGTPLTQTVTNIPNGVYVLNVLVASGDGADKPKPNIFLTANEEHSTAYNISDGDNKVFHDVSYEFKVLNGQATIGVIGGNDAGEYVDGGHWWYKADNFRLIYKGVDLSIIKEAYETALANATAARDNSEYINIVGVEKTNLLNAISLQPAENKSELEAATTALLNATTAFTASKSDYDALAAEKTIAAGLGMSEESIASAAATTKTGLVALQDLKVAEYNYIQSTYTENATLGSWTEDFASDLDGEGYKAGGPKYLDDWQGNKTTRTTKQTVTLPAGDYALSVIARGQAGASGNLYYKIGDVTTDIALIMKGNRGRGVDVNGVANFSEEGEYNCNGEGFGWEYRFITFHLNTDTQVEIGASITIQGQWASVYAPVLLTTEASVKALRLSEIATALGNVPTGKMDASIQDILNNAVADAEEVTSASTIDELNSVSTALTEAIANAKASVADYSRLAKYIEMTKVFTDVNAYETNYNEGEYTADDVETVRQELNVLRFNAASEIFPNKIEVTGWEGSMGGKNTSGQHWDGTDTKYYDNNSWNGNAHSTMTSIELPKGTYVLKAALRSSANTTLTLTVLDQIVNVEGKGDTGYGVDTKGDANFSSDGSYANNNAGRGWEWEFVKFELEEITTVTLKVECNYNGVYGWASFSDITLWMDDETYMTVNGHAINEPLADAKALVDTKPMGAAENDALKAAIALGENVSTAQELTKAIEDLNTAVANAKGWVAAYNEAKAPLVAALERFETDYNDAQNGALNHMNKERWATAISMAQAAAVAKDVTDSYDGFAAAADNLVAALDAATISINEYAALDEAIKNAEALAGANVGDQPFQRSADAINGLGIAEAQATYTAATAESEVVTSVTETLKAAINGIVLNAPAEGQRFYMVIDYEGWEHDGKAVTYLAGGRNDAGLYNIQYYAAPNANYAQAFTFTAVEGKADCYTLSMTDVDGNERYVSTGTVYGGNANQIRTTTEASQALAVKVIATATEGVWNLYNTEANQYIGGQDAGFYTVNSHINFNLRTADKAEVALNISDAKWSTLILPFNAELPEGVVAYSCEEVSEDGVTLNLIEVKSLKANTPYLVNGEDGKYGFTGYGLATKDSYTVGLFTGTYVDYQTEADKNIYVLQKNEAGLGFYLVGENAQPWVRAYRCYMTNKGAGAPMFRIGEDETTSIHNSEFSTQDSAVVYDLMGRKVTNMMKGNMYIVNGKKVVVK